jgi:hypothetical protein
MEHPVRKQFREDLRLAGMAETSQGVYLEAADLFFKRSWLTPEHANQEDFIGYIKFLRETNAAKGTFKVARHALTFLFQNTLQRDWPVFKKRFGRQDRKDFPKRSRTRTA